jgi:fructuronate reductase
MTTSTVQTSPWPTAHGYTPEDHDAGIIHIGVGAFHRAHQAVYTDDALAKFGGDWRILGVSLRSAATAQALNAQAGRYHVVIRADQATAPDCRVIGAIAGVLTAQNGIDPILDALCDPKIKIVSLTITEKAYAIDRQTGGLDHADPLISADLKTPNAPQSVIGLLVRALHLRMETGRPAFTLLSCDNLPDNGHLLRAAVLAYATEISTELAAWIKENASFPCTMVDRITPACTPALLAETKAATGRDDLAPIETEPFSQWVVEDDFCAGRPAWDKVGALMVADVAPYEKMKLRMLNGAHSLLAYAGFLSGHAYVRDTMQDPALTALVARHITAAAATLAPLDEIDFAAYGADLIARFQNPNIAHETYQIAMDGSQKMPQRIFEPALETLDAGGDVDSFAFATAAWIRYLTGQHDHDAPYALRDPREAELAQICSAHHGDATAMVKGVFALSGLVPARLVATPDFTLRVAAHLSHMLASGMKAAIAQATGETHA